MNAPHRVTGVHAGTVLRGETIAQLNEAVAPPWGTCGARAAAWTATSPPPHDTREPSAGGGAWIVSGVETSVSPMMEVSTRACSSASRATLSRSPWADGGSSYGAQGFVLCAALRDQCVIIRGVEQLLLSDSPVSGMVLATHEGAQQECNRPDQLWQCRYHCYSDLGFLLPIQTSPPPLTRTSALCQPSHLLSSVSTPRQECCWPGGDAVEAPPSSHRPPSCRVA